MKGPYTVSLRHASPLSLTSTSENSFCVVRGFLYLMERQDPLLVGHGERTAQYALALGHAVDLPERELLYLQYAALLHDLGKFLLPVEYRQGADLTPQQDEAHQCHPRAGAALLQAWPALNSVSVLIAHHHERWDGYGYPYGLRGSLIPLGSRILGITDAFDNLISPLPHGDGQTLEQAMQVLKGSSGGRFDPELTEVFLQLIPSLFRMSNEIESKLARSGMVQDLVT